jgi:hypothetical protein
MTIRATAHLELSERFGRVCKMTGKDTYAHSLKNKHAHISDISDEERIHVYLCTRFTDSAYGRWTVTFVI